MFFFVESIGQKNMLGWKKSILGYHFEAPSKRKQQQKRGLTEPPPPPHWLEGDIVPAKKIHKHQW